ncbi:hypothetical protein LZT09_13930 [Vibrio fluvialis]|uniref:hypothetical protein n=1 Tax=Vibrio fluvialis TaxID=676 RepID=UPI001F1C7E63|nr:hypothetical protein [Vibrio fluvialis]MCE7615727.1 hypothetical protein [Vibrio fluvialis]
MNILSLVPESEESAFNTYIDSGVIRIKSNREFCGLTVAKFVDWMFEQDIPHRMVVGLVREIMATDFTKQMSSHNLLKLEKFQEDFNELLEKYIKENWKAVAEGYREQKKHIAVDRAIDQFELLKISNY